MSQVYVVLQIKPRDSCMLYKHYTNRTISPTPWVLFKAGKVAHVSLLAGYKNNKERKTKIINFDDGNKVIASFHS